MSAFRIRCLVLPITFTALKSFSRSGHYCYFKPFTDTNLSRFVAFQNFVEIKTQENFKVASAGSRTTSVVKNQTDENWVNFVTRPRQFSVFDCCRSILPILVCVVWNENDHPRRRDHNYRTQTTVRKDACNIRRQLNLFILTEKFLPKRKQYKAN